MSIIFSMLFMDFNKRFMLDFNASALLYYILVLHSVMLITHYLFIAQAQLSFFYYYMWMALFPPAINHLTYLHIFGKETELSYLVSLSYFLSLQATFSLAGLHLYQSKYTRVLMEFFSMTDCKSCSIPKCAKKNLSTHDEDILPDAAKYCQQVGSLQYFLYRA